jgi:hypothetical protein
LAVKAACCGAACFFSFAALSCAALSLAAFALASLCFAASASGDAALCAGAFDLLTDAFLAVAFKIAGLDVFTAAVGLFGVVSTGDASAF